jgi:hypothetical protein
VRGDLDSLATAAEITAFVEQDGDILNGRRPRERRGARTIEGLGVRIAGRLLALAAGLRHDRNVGRPDRHVTAYAHSPPDAKREQLIRR